MSISERIAEMKAEMQKEQIDPVRGLGTELFLFTSTLTPMINVDLLVTNSKGEILLSWRDDPHCGTGWHIPGGCIRLNETFEARMQKTALSELGSTVSFEPAPIEVFEIFTHDYRPGLAEQRERSHFITLTYLCFLPDDYVFPADRCTDGEVGCLKWFPDLPADFLETQSCYRGAWDRIRARIQKTL